MLTKFESQHHDEYEHYDAQQVQRSIEEGDALVKTGQGIAQGCILVGFQVVSVEVLTAMGCLGGLTLSVASIPVGIALITAIDTITIDNGLSISDLGKFWAGMSRCGLLIVSSCKLYSDASNADKIAREGIETIKQQVYSYEKRLEPSKLEIGWMPLLGLLVGTLVISRVFKTNGRAVGKG